VKRTLKSVKKFKTLLYTAVGTASYQQWLQQVLCGGSGAGEKKQSCTYRTVSALNWLVKEFHDYHLTHLHMFCMFTEQKCFPLVLDR